VKFKLILRDFKPVKVDERPFRLMTKTHVIIVMKLIDGDVASERCCSMDDIDVINLDINPHMVV